MTETFVQNMARGLYRWEEPEQGWNDIDPPWGFNEGDAIKIDPFPDRLENSTALWPIYGTFREYVTDDIVQVYIPPISKDNDAPVWFIGGEGEYLIHEGYLTPQ